jgi:hypothetical protein
LLLPLVLLLLLNKPLATTRPNHLIPAGDLVLQLQLLGVCGAAPSTQYKAKVIN